MNNWTDLECDILRKYYPKLSVHEIHEKYLYWRPLKGIKKKLYGLKLKIPIRTNKHSFQEDFFRTPNDYNNYWAGYIAADGCISEQRGLILNCASKDVALLKKFKADTNLTAPICWKRNVTITDKKTNKIYKCDDITRISIWTRKLWDNDLLLNWNITPRKSLNLKPPNLYNKNHILQYIIGYLDGDGSISYGKDKIYNHSYLILNFSSGSYTLINWIQSHLYKYCLPHETRFNKIMQSRENYCAITWTGTRAIAIHKVLKSIPTPFKLDRKWQISYTHQDF